MDETYLLHAACGALHQVDTYHRGLITYDAFLRALEDIGVRQGDREFHAVMRFCRVVDGGYVMFKGLLAEVAPAAPRAKQTTANLAIFPDDPPEGRYSPAPDERSYGTPSSAVHSEEVRRIYARWERGLVSNAALRDELQAMGIPPTAEFNRLLTACGPSRTMPFAKLMSALQVEENDGRRGRTYQEVSQASASQSGQSTPCEGSFGHGAPPALRDLICAFIDGAVPAVAFRQQLRSQGVAVGGEIDRLIRTHESDNSVRFADFARVLMRQPSECGSSLVRGIRGGGGSQGAGGGGLAAFALGRGGPEPAASSASQSSFVSQSFASAPERGHVASTPPWASGVDASPSGSMYSGSRAECRPRSRGGVGHRNSGDILSWSGESPEERPAAARPPPQDDFLRWAGPRSHGAPPETDAAESRFGKRYYASGPSAAPYGTESGAAGGWDPQPPRTTPAPFGTDADCGRRPGDAGTMEFRAALVGDRRRGGW